MKRLMIVTSPTLTQRGPVDEQGWHSLKKQPGCHGRDADFGRIIPAFFCWIRRVTSTGDNPAVHGH
jgi:hypothetical protein